MRVPAASDDDLYWGGRNAKFASDDQQIWFERILARGWTAPTWPKEYGGAGLDPQFAETLQEEMSALGACPPLAGWGLTLLGPTLLRYGSDALKREHLPAIARGEIRWCQGFSEPKAGSDLASLATRADRTETGFVVNGQKIWTTYGDRSDRMFCLVRTDRAAPKHEGISFILIDMASPGVVARPISLISGSCEFCEVFFDDVIVAADQLVGELNRGWEVAKFLLGCEREVSGRLKAQGATSQRAMFNERGVHFDGVQRDAIARFDIEAWAFSALLSEMSQLAALNLERPGLGSAIKYVGAELNKSRLELEMTVHGADALLWQGSNNQDGLLARTWLRTKANSIAGGSNEMQLNIVARRVLGLPDRPLNRMGEACAIDLDEDLHLVRQAVRGILGAVEPKADVRCLRGQEKRVSIGLWRVLCEAGYGAVLAPSEAGGLPLGIGAASVILQELGRAIVRLPFLATSVMSMAGLRRSGKRAFSDRLVADMAAGSIGVTLAIDEAAKHDPCSQQTLLEAPGGNFVLNGAKRFVPDANACELIITVVRLASGDCGIVVISAAAKGVSIHRRSMIDEGDWGDIDFVDVEIERDCILATGEEASTMLQAMLDAGRIGAAAELIGIGDEVCERTVAFMKSRRQFGKFLSEYQALQHRIALVHIRLELARAALRAAARQVDEGGNCSGAASAAKFQAGDAATLAVQEAVQIHGGIAMTDAADIGFFMKRARVLCELYGDAAFQADRFATGLGY